MTTLSVPSIPSLECSEQQDEFQRYITRKPRLIRQLKALALALKNAGHKSYSIDALCHVVRFNEALNGRVVEINNNFTSRLARHLMQDRRLEGFFKTRKLATN